MKINCLIVEDEVLSTRYLESLLAEISDFRIKVSTAKDVTTARKQLDGSTYDIVFLDICLDGQNGFDLLDSFDTESRSFNVIFTTAHSDYSIRAFKYAAVDYLLKPIERNELSRAIRASMNRVERIDKQKLLKSQLNGFENDVLAIPTMGCIEFIKFDKIFYCKADSSYTQVVSMDGSFLASKTLKSIEELLAPFGFHRVHASYLVNLNLIKRYIKGVGGQVLMENGDLVPVSIRRKDSFLQRLQKTF